MKTYTREREQGTGAAFFLVILLAAAACRTVGQPGSSTAPANDALGKGHTTGPLRENALDTDVDASAPASARPASALAAPAGWTKAPEASGELFSALDGVCNDLAVSILENETLVHYRIQWGPKSLARVTDDAITVDPALGTIPGELQLITGHWPDRTYAVVSEGSRVSNITTAARFDAGKWKPAFAIPEGVGVANVKAYGNGAIGVRGCGYDGGSRSQDCTPGPFMGDNAKAPPIAGDGFQPIGYETLPSGEIYVVGEVCKGGSTSECAPQFRWWAPGAKVGYAPMGSISTGYEWHRRDHVVVKSKTEVYVTLGDYFGVFDGTKLRKLTAPGKRSGAIAETKDGALWIESDNKLWQRKSDGSFDDVSPPGYTGQDIAGIKLGAPWVMTKDSVYKYVAAAWQKVALPRPPFASASSSYLSPESVHVRAPDDVFVIATYHEMPRGWNEAERRRTLLRTKRPKETMRCDVGAGIQSWPATATEACATPFLVLAPVSATSPKDYDYPQTRAIIRAKAALVMEASLVEIRENRSVWIGLVPRSLADGQALLELYGSKFPMTRPTLVCAEPTITRKIPIR